MLWYLILFLRVASHEACSQVVSLARNVERESMYVATVKKCAIFVTSSIVVILFVDIHD